jgi:hypothetical protein
MKHYLLLLFLLISPNKNTPIEIIPVRVITDGFNCTEGVIIADQVRDLVKEDSLLQIYSKSDSAYIIVEITSYRDGGTSVINAGFSRVTPLQKSKLDYTFTRRLITQTLEQMKEISKNILEKIHLIRKY